jgi:hypothetical protein
LKPNELFRRTQFEGKELRNFRYLDWLKTLEGKNGAALLAHVQSLIGVAENRQKALRPVDATSRELTISTLLANLAALALNPVDDAQFLGVSFNRNDYVDSSLSFQSMVLLRDVLLANGLIEGSGGGRRIRENDTAFGWLTRIRPTPALRTVFADCDIGWASIKRAVDYRGYVLREPAIGVPLDAPIDVEMSRQVMDEVNRRIEDARIELPDDAWVRINPRMFDEMDLEDDRSSAGDLTRKSLVRIFKYDWSQGGRLYGGWWMSLPKQERELLTIDGEPTIELDYGQLHPSILYARAREQIDGDAYTLGEWTGSAMRELGKTTFARMLNSKPGPGDEWVIRVRDEDADKLPPGLTSEAYISAFQHKMEPISQWFWIGEGLRLQREDSDLPISVLKAISEQGVVALPVHDSFIVQGKHKTALYLAMLRAYREKFYYTPIVK